jgi:hypothetical protein
MEELGSDNIGHESWMKYIMKKKKYIMFLLEA